MKTKIYHIYAGNTCLLHSVPEEEFEVTWKTLNQLSELMNGEYHKDELSYEELEVQKEFTLNASY